MEEDKKLTQKHGDMREELDKKLKHLKSKTGRRHKSERNKEQQMEILPPPKYLFLLSIVSMNNGYQVPLAICNTKDLAERVINNIVEENRKQGQKAKIVRREGDEQIEKIVIALNNNEEITYSIVKLIYLKEATSGKNKKSKKQSE